MGNLKCPHDQKEIFAIIFLYIKVNYISCRVPLDQIILKSWNQQTQISDEREAMVDSSQNNIDQDDDIKHENDENIDIT